MTLPSVKRIIFFGTPEFASIHLQALIRLENQPGNPVPFSIVGVFTQPDKPVGRKQEVSQSPVKRLALQESIPVYQPEQLTHPDVESTLINFAPDLGIIVAYGKIIPKNLIQIPRLGMINIHASLVPELRGASPIQYAILQGLHETGISIFQIEQGIDTGPVFIQRSLPIHSNETSTTLSDRLADLGAKTLSEMLPKLLTEQIQAHPQQGEGTLCKTLKKEQGRLDWHESAEQIERKIRGLNPWPGTITAWKAQKKNLKILKASLATIDDVSSDIKKGQVFEHGDGRILVKTGEGFLQLFEVQLEGKKPLLINEFLLGHPDFLNTILD